MGDADLEVKKGNKGFDLEFTIQNDDGTPKNLTGYTITFKVWKVGASVLSLSKACTIVDAGAGTCKYTLGDGDFDVVGKYYFELELTKAGVVEDTETKRLDVLETAPSS
jgi:hypothetical protein